jgi:leucine dehydrogenase
MPIQKKQRRFYQHEALMRYAKRLGFGEIHTKIDHETGLHAMIAIHSNKLGPAIGGSRLHAYSSAGAGLKDALRLSYMMTLKAAISNLPHGGAKAVIIKPAAIKDRQALFESYGDFVHEMNGRYIAAIDVGTSTDDMDVVATRTPYVIGDTKSTTVEDANPSPLTAMGVLRSIEGAAQFHLNKDSVEGLHVAIQGAGSVAYYLSKLLHERGARITVCDPHPEAAQRIADECQANVVDISAIYDVSCDIFSPCALGGTITTSTMDRLQCRMIVGAANNQLAHRDVINTIDSKGMIYVPDYLANSGGLIHAAMVYDYKDARRADEPIAKLKETTIAILERAKSEKQSTTVIAENMAIEKLGWKKTHETTTAE